jgi:hypothetical protein
VPIILLGDSTFDNARTPAAPRTSSRTQCGWRAAGRRCCARSTLRAALDRGLDIIELRAICREPSDDANPIEPSGRGGLKIARAIASWALEATPRSRIFVTPPSSSE